MTAIRIRLPLVDARHCHGCGLLVWRNTCAAFNRYVQGHLRLPECIAAEVSDE